MTPDPATRPADVRGGALADVVVLEIAGTPAGELAGGLLADLGATVIKIEPADGSPMRRCGLGGQGRTRRRIRFTRSSCYSGTWRD